MFPSKFGQVFNSCEKPELVVGIKGNVVVEQLSRFLVLDKQDVSTFDNVIYNSATKFWDKEFLEYEHKVDLKHTDARGNFMFMFSSKNENPFTIIVFY